MKRDKTTNQFKKELLSLGAEILGETNPYEVLRFKTKYGVGVVYKGKRGETWNPEAIKAREHVEAQRGSLAHVQVAGKRKDKSTVGALLTRDGDICFFCGSCLDGDVTVEHLVPRSHGGPNHISNYFLSHAACNAEAGHLSAPEKVKLALGKRS